MKKIIIRLLIIGLILSNLTPVKFNNVAYGEEKEFTVLWSIYAGWQPWDYANQSGILKKWADKHKIKINLKRMDYIPSIEAYVSKKADACVMTNMEALDMPAASGISSTALILGDYSNGNDAVITRDKLDIKSLKGLEISLSEFSVSHYLLVRALEMNGMKESDVKVLNTSDSDIAPAFIANPSQKAVVTWNPLVMQIMQQKGMTNIFDSSKIPGEILDLMIVRTEVLKKNPELGKALTGAWYEVMDIMSKNDDLAKKAKTIMSTSAGCSIDEYEKQLSTTAMFYKADDAVKYVTGNDIKKNMNYVRTFCYKHGLLGENAKSVDEVGIMYPDGSIQGDKKNVQLIFTDKYMKEVIKK